ncbi:MAG: hypothetical protein K2N56_04165 [Oscillospiraceae bacterium]|nr:hypothetical protein [Oscillospiraceae bacterium]
MTEEQRARLAELKAANAASLARKGIQREMERIVEWIPDFNEKYVFADGETLRQALEFVDGLPFKRPGWIDVERFPKRREYFPGNADGRRIRICFLAGSAELLQMAVEGRVCDYFTDVEDWDCVCPFTVLVYEDLGGFIFIDDNGDMTEVVL